MFDEEEYSLLHDLIVQGIKATKEYREKFGIPLDDVPRDVRFGPVSELHRQMTGIEETNHNAIGHHRLSIYGPPCTRCGKSLRTPRARYCPDCGQTREVEQERA